MPSEIREAIDSSKEDSSKEDSSDDAVKKELTMKLERARELYSDYTEGTLTPAMRLALEQHFEADSAARADYDEFAHLYTLLGAADAPSVEVPLGFRAKVLELAAAQQSQRQETPALRFRDWFENLGRRRAAGGALAMVVIALGLIAAFHSAPSKNNQADLVPSITLANAPSTVIQSVTSQQGTDNNLYHMFHLHLPPGSSGATVSAYVVNDLDAITDPTVRAHATPALKQPQHLNNDEEMQIPIALLAPAPAGSTLNLLVRWTPDNGQPDGAQAVFMPIDISPSAPPMQPTAPGDLYDALQAIAATYHVTIIADATVAPTETVTPNLTASDANKAIQAVLTQCKDFNYSVLRLPDGSYQVYKP